ncbi:MAG: ABC transporter ATP-binding protein [Kiritimatiellaeota bacterium]|nr:ABC transporter ATP-binding protein [Kiritimatiellota bacterium]
MPPTKTENVPDRPGTAGTKPPPVLRLEGVTKEYVLGTTAVPALQGVSFSLDPGEYVAIMGPSGSGKSTLLNLLGCLDTATSGAYYLDGEDVSGLNDSELSRVRREKIGFVFQSFNLIPQINVLENIEVPLFYMGWHERDSRERATELARRVGLGDRLKHRPTELSGGQRQRVAIARALANDPHLILADEPTGNLDSRTSAEIMAVLDDLVNQGRTVVLVTHETDIALHARRVIQLADGRIVRDERRRA